MTESIQDIIARLKTKQKAWWKHLAGEGYHVCQCCRKRPVSKDKALCAFCLDAKRKNPWFKPEQPAKPTASDKPNLRLLPKPDKEQPDDNK